MMLVPANRRQIRGKIKRQIDPALLDVALYKICNTGPAEPLMISSSADGPPETKRRTMRKMTGTEGQS